ncbi:MAG: hypothetical protein AAFY46_10675, partial [Planctomycetota bacterium]
MNAESTFNRYTVLYVDDFEPERMLLTHKLRESSIGLTAVASVDEAIDALNRRSFDVVVSDLHLDRGRSGNALQQFSEVFGEAIATGRNPLRPGDDKG